MRLGRAAGQTDTGRRRRQNEDAFVCEPPLFAVADGMGGAQAGELASRLAAGWSMARLDKPMKALLRVGAYELLARKDVPVASVISEYVDVAKAFYDKRESGFVNGLLDALAKVTRPAA